MIKLLRLREIHPHKYLLTKGDFTGVFYLIFTQH